MVWVLVVAGAYLLLGLFTTILIWQNKRTPPQGSPEDFGLPYREVWFNTANEKRLHGWLVARSPESPEVGRSPVILVHGWGRNASRMLVYIRAVAKAGFMALAFDARHHGLSDRDGFASMKKFSEDIRAAADFLQKKGYKPPFPVIGLSIGGSAALHAAAHDTRLGPIVTIGAFAHPRDAMLALGFGRFFFAPIAPLLFRFMEWRVGASFDALAPENLISQLQCSVLLVHGVQDRVVPVAHAERLKSRAGSTVQLWVMAQRGHSDIHMEPGFLNSVVSFLREHSPWDERRSYEAAKT